MNSILHSIKLGVLALVSFPAGEVNHIGQNAANSVLCVVHGITVKGKGRPKPSGGNMNLMEPFDLSLGLLKPLAFTFRRKR